MYWEKDHFATGIMEDGSVLTGILEGEGFMTRDGQRGSLVYWEGRWL